MPTSTIRRTAKAVLVYATLVVPPGGALALVLHAGQRLHPPQSIGGDWVVARTAQGACGRVPATQRLVLHVSQSGTRAVATFSDAAHTTLELELRGTALAGAQPGNGCRLALDATLQPSRELDGTLHWRGCTGCWDEPFHAARSARGGRPR
jgi:hypothetical protein